MKLWTLAALAAVSITAASCAGVYDRDAWAGANAQQQLSLAQCRAHVSDKTYTSVGQFVECELGAERQMATAVKLNKMEVFEAYAGRMRLTAQQADARQITPEQMSAQFAQAHSDFEGQISQAVAYDAQRRAAIAAGFAAMGQAMQQQADREAYIQAHQQQPFNCTSSAFGGTVTTHCN